MSEAEDIKVGDVVYVRSGSPAMTVNRINTEDCSAELIWFDESELNKMDAPLVILTLIDPDLAQNQEAVMRDTTQAMEMMRKQRRLDEKQRIVANKNPDGSVTMDVVDKSADNPPS